MAYLLIRVTNFSNDDEEGVRRPPPSCSNFSGFFSNSLHSGGGLYSSCFSLAFQSYIFTFVSCTD